MEEKTLFDDNEKWIAMAIVDEPWVCSKVKCKIQTNIFIYAYIKNKTKRRYIHKKLIKHEFEPVKDYVPAHSGGYLCLDHLFEFFNILGVPKEELGYILI